MKVTPLILISLMISPSSVKPFGKSLLVRAFGKSVLVRANGASVLTDTNLPQKRRSPSDDSLIDGGLKDLEIPLCQFDDRPVYFFQKSQPNPGGRLEWFTEELGPLGF